ncbi:head-tail adaptor protein [Streptomyces sp. CNQ085]|uniref:phage head completion protein n=1 Tax=Streptomyces sp. CNQ085 TaxID=2886944 RepID=UPI001F508B28|nr:head-tail adaptor protein [Streptomyces sp. CNQ085]MCI0384585.1 head-tail adaptor protein [Streptomyces sp. CNQ085]
MSRIARLLNIKVPVWRATTVDDGGGGQSTEWAQVGTPRARRSQPTARERTSADQAGAALDEVWYFAPSADVRRGDELRPPGRVLKVVATFEPSVPGTYLRANCTLHQPTR